MLSAEHSQKFWKLNLYKNKTKHKTKTPHNTNTAQKLSKLIRCCPDCARDSALLSGANLFIPPESTNY